MESQVSIASTLAFAQVCFCLKPRNFWKREAGIYCPSGLFVKIREKFLLLAATLDACGPAQTLPHPLYWMLLCAAHQIMHQHQHQHQQLYMQGVSFSLEPGVLPSRISD